MTVPDRTAEIRANWERAQESLAAARTLLHEGYADYAASRAYYAAFYAASALLLSMGLGFKKHSSVIAAVHREFVRSGKLPPQAGKALNRLFELRGLGDYGEQEHVSEPDARKAIELAEGFIRHVESLIPREP